jgi:hypothetical protein
MWSRAFAVIVLMTGAACDGRGPIEDLAPLLESLGDPTRPTAALSGELYRVLDDSSRSSLAERASKMSNVVGVNIDAAELIQARGVGAGRRVSKVELLERGDASARLRVYFETIAPDSGGSGRMPLPPAAPLDLTARLEEGRWRLELPELERALGAAGGP